MAETAEDPTGRALALLSLLTSRPHWRGDELAQRLGVTTRTLRRDVERLRRLGYDVDATPGTDGGYRLRAGGSATPPLFLDGDESVAVTAALHTAATDGTTGMVDASVRALAKLQHVVPAGARGGVDAVRRSTRRVGARAAPPVDPQHVATLAAACRDGRAVRFAYRRRDGEASQRRAEPSALVTVRDVWYLVAYDLARADWRLFRVDRMDAVELTGHGASRRTVPGGDPTAFVGASLAEMPYPHVADVTVARPGAELLAALRWLNPRRVRSDGAGACTLHLGAASVGALVSELLDVVRLGAPTTISTTPEVRAGLHDVAVAVASALGDDPATTR